MKFLILGDVHGDWCALNITIARAIKKYPDITHIVQCGDWGYGWGGSKPFKVSKAYFDQDAMRVYKQAKKYFLDGNHENFDKLEADGGAWQPEWQYMPRGSVLEIPREDGSTIRAMFFGGASSIDKPMRIPHISWWPQESITYGQVAHTLENVNGQLDAIFSHEHPASVPYSDKRYGGKLFGDGDKNLLEVLRDHYKPKWQFFGHHHAWEHGLTKGTEWVCCPIIESFHYVIWDGNSIECSWWERETNFFRKFRRSSGCWQWTGAIGTHGYGNWYDGERYQRAHRYAYEYFCGQIPTGMVVDHKCRNRACVNPEHMEIVTQRTNVLRGENHTADQMRQTHCINGHEFDETNTYIDKRDKRHCRKCRVERQRKYRKNKTS